MRSSKSCDSSSAVTRLVLINPPSEAYVPITGLALNTLLGSLPGRSDACSQSADSWKKYTPNMWHVVCELHFNTITGQQRFWQIFTLSCVRPYIPVFCVYLIICLKWATAVNVSCVISSVKSKGQAECTLSRHPKGLRPNQRVTAGSWGKRAVRGFRVSL